MYHFPEKIMHAISNNIFYIDHMKNAGIPVSPS